MRAKMSRRFGNQNARTAHIFPAALLVAACLGFTRLALSQQITEEQKLFIAGRLPAAAPSRSVDAAGSFRMSDTISVLARTSSGCSSTLSVSDGDVFLLKNRFGIAVVRERDRGAIVGASRTVYLSNVNLIGDGRISIDGLLQVVGFAVSTGVVIGNQLAFASRREFALCGQSPRDTVELAERAWLTPSPIPLDSEFGPYEIVETRARFRSSPTADAITAPVEWAGELVFVETARGDSLAMLWSVRNDRGGGGTYWGAVPWAGPGATIRFELDGGEGAQVRMSYGRGRVAGRWRLASGWEADFVALRK